MNHDHTTARRTGRFAGLTRSLLVVVTMAAMVSLPSMGAFASTRTHAGGSSGNTNGGTAPQAGLDVGLSPTWGLGFINSAVDMNTLVNAMGRPFGASGLYAPLTGWSFPTDQARQVADDGGRLGGRTRAATQLAAPQRFQGCVSAGQQRSHRRRPARKQLVGCDGAPGALDPEADDAARIVIGDEPHQQDAL